MTARWPRVALILGLALAPSAIGAQSKQDLQTQQDIRMLQQQIQELRLAVAALAEQAKATNAKLDGQVDLMRKNNADQSSTLQTVQTQANALVEKLNSYTQELQRFSSEIPSIRKGLAQQQTTLDKIVGLMAVPAPTASGNVDRGTPPPPGTVLPGSPGQAFQQAKSFYTVGTDYEMAAQTFEDFLQKFPDAAPGYGGEANFLLGMSYFKLGKYPQALAAFTTVTEKYATTDYAADASYYRGEVYGAQGRPKDAQAAWTETIKQFPDTSAAIRAKGKCPACGGTNE
jgi:TolA-binding protein